MYRNVHIELSTTNHWYARGWWWSHPDITVVHRAIDELLNTGKCVVTDNHALHIIS